MFNIYCPIINKNNNTKLHEKIIEYQKINPCCLDFPNCPHPLLQTDSELHKTFTFFEESLKSIFNNVSIKRTWAFITMPNSKINSMWHNHESSESNFSTLCYLTEDGVGTQFEGNFILKPNKNHWNIFDSKLMHTPLNKKINKLRISIASEVLIEV
jgi:hypothetical protein